MPDQSHLEEKGSGPPCWGKHSSRVGGGWSQCSLSLHSETDAAAQLPFSFLFSRNPALVGWWQSQYSHYHPS